MLYDKSYKFPLIHQSRGLIHISIHSGNGRSCAGYCGGRVARRIFETLPASQEGHLHRIPLLHALGEQNPPHTEGTMML